MEEKNFELNYAGLEDYMVEREPHRTFGGVHFIFHFENGYGASVIKHVGSYGYSEDLWELATIQFDDDFDSNTVHQSTTWDLAPIPGFDEIIHGDLTDDEVRELLFAIKEVK